MEEFEYIYISSSKYIKKLDELNINFKYIPYINNDNIDIQSIIESKILLCYKNPNIIYGYYKITNIITNNENGKEYKNNKILINEENYNKISNEYNLGNPPRLYFLKIDIIKIFEYKIILKDLNNFIKINYPKINEIKYPFNIKIFDLIKFDIKEIINLIEEYLEELTSEDEEDDNFSETSEKSEFNENSVIIMIPILWICCDKLLSEIDECLITKKILKNHYFNCKRCEIVNNNDKELYWNKKKAIFKEIDNIKELNNIIKYYQYTNNYIIKDINIFNKNEFDLNKINLLYFNNTDSIYDKCIFILNN